MTVTLDILQGSISVSESAGIITSAKRTALVSGNWSSLSAAAGDILSDANLPAVGHKITINGQDLHLEDRDVRLIDGGDAEVELAYKRRDTPETMQYRIGTSVEQVTTQLDREGNPITVTHNGVTQGGEISADDSLTVLEAEFVTQSATPGTVVATWGNKVNSTAWMGGAPGEWRVTHASAELVDSTTSPHPEYRFRFQFTHRAGGWQPAVAFVDPETGNPPPGLVAGTGYKTVNHYHEIDFNTVF